MVLFSASRESRRCRSRLLFLGRTGGLVTSTQARGTRTMTILRRGRVSVPPDVLVSKLEGESASQSRDRALFRPGSDGHTRVASTHRVRLHPGRLQTLLDEFAGDGTELEQDLTVLFDQLVEAGLLTVSDD